MSLDQWTKVAAVGDLPDGEMIGVDAGQVKICLARVEDKYYAMNDICSHFATRLSGGEFYPDDLEVECPLHDSRFSLVDGSPHEVPADEPVQVYAVRVDGDEIVVGPAEEGQ
ncbi:non-heme iron oxygenase ferredoxin subunit [Nocardioides sp. NPDC006303]|uniref:Rieske (2Fe-2S) protein n=1 Tax=Nocardioides sp. NPDC006303 TaxID=3156747 RepID=UPI0033BAC7BB